MRRDSIAVRLRRDRFRIPDVCVCAAPNTDMRSVTTAPLVVVEVLSPEDRIANNKQRIAGYVDMGIRGVWVVIPETRKGWDGSSGLRPQYSGERIRRLIST